MNLSKIIGEIERFLIVTSRSRIEQRKKKQKRNGYKIAKNIIEQRLLSEGKFHKL